MQKNKKRKREYVYAGLVIVGYSAFIYASLAIRIFRGDNHEKG